MNSRSTIISSTAYGVAITTAHLFFIIAMFAKNLPVTIYLITLFMTAANAFYRMYQIIFSGHHSNTERSESLLAYAQETSNFSIKS